MSPSPSLPQALQQALAPLGRYGMQENVALAPHTSFQIGGPARWLLTVQQLSDLIAALHLLHRYEVPFFLLGGGTNILISDAGIDGLVLLNQCRSILWPETDPPIVTADSGAALAGLARASLQHQITGLAWAASIPGTVGGAVVGNAGAHGHCIADHLLYATLWRRDRIVRVTATDLQFDYRSSSLKQAPTEAATVLLSATLQLGRHDIVAEQQRAQRFIEHRRRSQPTAKSAGSIFKNPPHEIAGRLIEAAGLKGWRQGQAAVSNKHANFIINLGGATANDVAQLIHTIRDRVSQHSGILLESEIQLVGDWPSPHPLQPLSSTVNTSSTCRLRVGVLFGGRSGEHEVSLQSAQSVLQAIDDHAYEVVPIGIDHDGRWMFQPDALSRLLAGEGAGPEAPAWPRPADLAGLDVILPILHGTYGEDGTLQGLLDLAGIPYVGCGVLASSLAMDKAVSKLAFAAAGLPQTPWYTLLRQVWAHRASELISEIEARLTYPLFVKPANLGSSVGISKAHDGNELQAAIDLAARFDRKIVVEQAVPNAREIEISVLGNAEPQASVPGEIVPSNEFYDYAAKYIDGSSKERIPAPITPAQSRRIQDMAIRAFSAIDGSGMARIDFLLDDISGDIILNEINTIPGFTSISMYPKLWAASGLPFPRLIDRLIELALARHAEKTYNETRFQPSA